MLRKITVAIEEETLKATQARAANRCVSVSALIAELLEQKFLRSDTVSDEAYMKAFEAWKKIKPVSMTRKIGTLSREEAHERG